MQEDMVVKKGALGVVPPLPPPLVSVPITGILKALCWDEASGSSQTPWSIRASMRRARGRICHFQCKVSGGY